MVLSMLDRSRTKSLCCLLYCMLYKSNLAKKRIYLSLFSISFTRYGHTLPATIWAVTPMAAAVASCEAFPCCTWLFGAASTICAAAALDDDAEQPIFFTSVQWKIIPKYGVFLLLRDRIYLF